MTSKNLPWHGLMAQLFLLKTQQEVPFINTSEATKRSSNRTENSKCKDVKNRRSRAGLSTPIAHFRVLTFLETGPEFGRESEASCEVRLGGAKIKRDRWFFYP